MMRAALADFYKRFKHEPLVVDKWFTLQASAAYSSVTHIRALMKHSAFTFSNPNRVRSLAFAFCNNNPTQFHAEDGSGYALWVDLVTHLNKINPQIAARLARSLDRWKKYPLQQQKLMRAALQKIVSDETMSRDVLEIINKSLGITKP